LGGCEAADQPLVIIIMITTVVSHNYGKSSRVTSSNCAKGKIQNIYSGRNITNWWRNNGGKRKT
jgi:hypothetical protein